MPSNQSLPNIVILTGAGISAESGLKTFRDNDGLWENHRVEEVATPEAFEQNPSLVYRFYNARRAQLQQDDVNPNAAHEALAKLEKAFDSNLMLVTQNVDDLHERGGSQSVYHMHGKLLSARCAISQQTFDWSDSFDHTTKCPCCNRVTLRPDIVWFGEMPMYMEEIYDALLKADVFIAIGTSGNVYPAAGFVQIAKESGAHTIEANLEPGVTNALFDESLTGHASHIVPQWVDQLISKYAL
ncbi:NAD-dependent deacetylase [Alteromonas macleodii str. 'Balearic Sea AD45']|jgi:NAD-dependent deacetylase|uniref:Sir2 family NAD+-dependent deacetylase n=1 Tax=Alteromonas macleodii TaxID=28108 RepID=UPI000286D722|nr:Sir2 family NAD+-dependent deacetylase [Alteromonas macleodii]AFT95539.1 NAD-dependent deacetylase [Alteromonas macleodii str. 'Balearic Sea AD45']PTU01571.1 NAD-dependent protein deacylase [Pseudomonas sp. HMWF031]